MSASAVAHGLLRALRAATGALHGFLLGFTGLVPAPKAADAAGRRALEEEAARRPRCC